ncbi:MAG: hypothetical protein ACFB02_12825 [Mastigocoleus sp.]
MLISTVPNISKKDSLLINSVSPAFIATPMTDAMMKQPTDQKEPVFTEAIAEFLKNNRPHLELNSREKVQEVVAVITFSIN